jgi:hypothetical protein
LATSGSPFSFRERQQLRHLRHTEVVIERQLFP